MSRVAVLALVVLIAFAGCATKPSPDQEAPELVIRDVDGEYARLSKWFGEPILLELFGVRCGSCEAMMSQLVPFHDEYGDRVHMISIDLGAQFDGLGARNEDEVRAWRDRFHANWTFALDDPRQMDAARAYPHYARPTLYLIDREATIDRLFEGWTPLETLKAEAERVLAEAPA